MTERKPRCNNRTPAGSVLCCRDGRATSLREQVLQPIQNPKELGMILEESVARLKHHRAYRKQFGAAFHEEPDAQDLARALASYVRTILSGDSPVDRYLNGENNALSDEARRAVEVGVQVLG